MPKIRDMRNKKCITLVNAILSNPKAFDDEGNIRVDVNEIDVVQCRGEDCAHWIWDDPYNHKEVPQKPLGEDRKGHCGRTQHKPFVVQGLPQKAVDDLKMFLQKLAQGNK